MDDSDARRRARDAPHRRRHGHQIVSARGGRRSRQAVPYTARFHIHPDVRVSSSYGRDILLKLPSGDGWRFQATGGEISLARSVYLGGDALRRCDQLVVSGSVASEPVELAWSFERIG